MTRLAGAHARQSLGKLTGTLLLKENFELSTSYTATPTKI
jgi:hypothetical protein